MNTTLEKLDNNLFKVNIEIDADVASQEYNKACKKFGETLNVPGFRKGKTPRPIVEKQVGADKIKQRALDAILPGVFADVISEHQLDLVTEPIIESYDFELGKPVTLVAKVEVKPEVKLPDYKGLTVEVPEQKVDEEAVNRELENLRQRFARMEQVIDRPVESDDIVFIDFSGSIEGEPIKGGTGKNHQIDIANSHFIPGFAEQLVGKNIGDESIIKVTFPEDYQEKSIAGKEAEFTVKINEIKKRILPELNDEFAQKVGPFQTIDDLKSDLSKYIEQARENEKKIMAEKAIVDKVVDETKLDIPDTMINREAKYLMEEVENRFKSQGMSWEQMIEQQGHENIWNSLREEATRRVKTSLVLGAIAKEENITITDEDFAAKVKELAEAYNAEEMKVYEQMSQNPSLAQGLSQQIMSQKIINYLFENNEVKYIEDTSNQSESE